MSRRAQIDLQNLGYTHADLCKCLANIDADDFRGVRDYGDGWRYDVYRNRFAGASGLIDELYVKVAHRDQPVAQVFVRSIHLSRF